MTRALQCGYDSVANRLAVVRNLREHVRKAAAENRARRLAAAHEQRDSARCELAEIWRIVNESRRATRAMLVQCWRGAGVEAQLAAAAGMTGTPTWDADNARERRNAATVQVCHPVRRDWASPLIWISPRARLAGGGELLRVLNDHPEGMRLLRAGNELGVDWRRLVPPAWTLLNEGRLERIDAYYFPVRR